MGDKLEVLLTEAVSVAMSLGALKPSAVKHVNVDTTVQEKAIAFPRDARLYQRMRGVLVRKAEIREIALRQSYRGVGKKAFILSGRCGSARQMKRAAKQLRELKTYLGRVIRDLNSLALDALLNRADQLIKQQLQDKNKLYSIHDPEVRCIAMGKIHKRYEFGSKASIVTTSTGNWLVSAQSLEENPYDVHILEPALEQVGELTGLTPEVAYCDQSYWGNGVKGAT